MKRFLILKTSSLGDIIHAMPAVSALSRFYPDAKIDWVVKPEFQGLPLALSCVERIILFRGKRYFNLFQILPEYRLIKREIRKVHYDAVIDLQGLWRTGFLAGIADTDVSAGAYETREKSARKYYSRILELPVSRNQVHAVDFNNALMAAFLGVSPEQLDFSVDIRQNTVAVSKSKDLLDEAFGGSAIDDYFLIAPGARWNTKRWPAEFFVSVIHALHDLFPEIPFLLIGSGEDVPICEKIESAVAGIPVASVAGRTDMLMLIEIIRHASALVCNDSGPMHIAAMVNTPVVALFGPTSPELTGPYAANSRVCIPRLDCVRCFRHSCPDLRCHAAVDPEEVASAVSDLLAASPTIQCDSL